MTSVFSDDEFAVLDLVSEGSYALSTLRDAQSLKTQDFIALLRRFVDQGLITLHEFVNGEERRELSLSEAKRELTATPFENEGDRWLEAVATSAGWEAYKRAYAERHPAD